MSVWFEGNIEIDCNIKQVKLALKSIGEFYAGIIGLMPGLKSAELTEEGSNFVVIKTDEGHMTRANMKQRIDDRSVVVEFDEEYRAKTMVTTKAYFVDEFTTSGKGVKYHTTISDLESTGLMGFFYGKFGASKTGNAFLAACKKYLENLKPD